MDTHPRQDDPRHLPVEFSDPETPSTDSHTDELEDTCPSADKNTTTSKHTHTHTHTRPSDKNTTTSKHTHTFTNQARSGKKS